MAHGLRIISDDQLPEFRQVMLEWFHANRRELDWRQTRDPYRIWISEVMLQQTRVAAVLPYYRRFLAEFPTVRKLARAALPDVLRCWAGLGYYSRARNLHRAAKEISEHHKARFPREEHECLALPGVGHYTAAAVLSIAYNAPHAVLDGNVARVLSRLGAIRGDLRQPGRWRRLAVTAGALLATEAPGDWNQAMMELGATVCVPGAPRCDSCPVARWCSARALGIASKLPSVRAKPKPVSVTLAAAVLLDPRKRTLLVRKENGDGALFSRLWQFPSVEASADAEKEVARLLRRDLRVQHPTAKRLAIVRHTVTFHRVKVIPFLVHVSRLPSGQEARVIPLDDLGRLPVSSVTRKIARVVQSSA